VYRQAICLEDLDRLPAGAEILVRRHLRDRYRVCTKNRDGYWLVRFNPIEEVFTTRSTTVFAFYLDIVVRWRDV